MPHLEITLGGGGGGTSPAAHGWPTARAYPPRWFRFCTRKGREVESLISPEHLIMRETPMFVAVLRDFAFAVWSRFRLLKESFLGVVQGPSPVVLLRIISTQVLLGPRSL